MEFGERVFGQIAVRLGYVSREAIEAAVRAQAEAGAGAPPLGVLLVERGALTAEQAAAVLRRQEGLLGAPPTAATADAEGRLFGQIAVAHGVASAEGVDRALGEQARRAAAGRAERLGEILVEMGALSVEAVVRVLEEQQARAATTRLGDGALGAGAEAEAGGGGGGGGGGGAAGPADTTVLLAAEPGQRPGAESVASSPDGRLFVASGSDVGGAVRLWDAATGNKLARLDGHTRGVASVAFSPDGHLIASRDASGTVLLWDPATATRVTYLPDALARDLLLAWEALRGPSAPTRLPGLGAVLLEGEVEWRTAWMDLNRDPDTGCPKRLSALLDRWERDLGMRVNLETGELERIPTPPPAYADDPKIAPLCK